MRVPAVLATVVAAAVLAAALAGPLASPARAADLPPPRLYWTLRATSIDGLPVYVGDEIIIPKIPTVLNVTVINDDPLPGVQHTFTIRSTAENPPSPYIVDTDYFSPGEQRTVEFTIVEPDRIVSGSRNETAELDGGFVKFFCIPHEAAGMVGRVVVGGVPTAAEAPEKGVFLRAYWIGLLGMAGTLLLIGLSYFVIKSSSRHFVDHREHVRRGGP
jgi:hypothetical protein